jgi:hypothetical protein
MAHRITMSSIVAAITIVLWTDTFAAIGGSATRASRVHASFNLETPQSGPFPGDYC